jgi:hypothetical protein
MDQVEDGGATLIYEGHDAPRQKNGPDPKTIDQPANSERGTITENGKFCKAVAEYKQGRRKPERVRVYEKLHQGIWAYNVLFHLTDCWQESDGRRKVFKFRLTIVEDDSLTRALPIIPEEPQRVIPTAVKLAVWKRDHGKCVVCGSKQDLHFDHILPFSKGGTSLKAENVQLLCARHNLAKHDNIE